jgi:hypothetical protein
MRQRVVKAKARARQNLGDALAWHPARPYETRSVLAHADERRRQAPRRRAG